MDIETSAQESSGLPPSLKGKIPTLRTFSMPADANANGDIFGGWILSQMDMAGGAAAYEFVSDRVVTVGIEAMTFYQPVFIGDEVSFYTEIVKSGHTSVTVRIESWARRRKTREYAKVTEGFFTFVRIDENRRPVAIDTAAGIKRPV